MKLFKFLFCMFSLVNQFTAHQIQMIEISSHIEQAITISAVQALPRTHGGERLEEIEELQGKIYTITGLV